MWVTNNLGYDIKFGDITIYKASQQEFSSADATKLNNNAMFVAMTTSGQGLVKSDSQPAVNPQYFVRPLSAPATLDGMPTNPDGYPAVSPAEAFEIGKSEGGDADLEDNHEATIDVATYTEPVEILPAEGKDGMKKTTVTLSNIPQPGGGGTYTLFVPRADLSEFFNKTTQGTLQFNQISFLAPGDLTHFAAGDTGTLDSVDIVLTNVNYQGTTEKFHAENVAYTCAEDACSEYLTLRFDLSDYDCNIQIAMINSGVEPPEVTMCGAVVTL